MIQRAVREFNNACNLCWITFPGGHRKENDVLSAKLYMATVRLRTEIEIARAELDILEDKRQREHAEEARRQAEEVRRQQETVIAAAATDSGEESKK